MSVVVTYNGYTLPLPLGKFTFRELKDSAQFSTDFAIDPADVATAIAALEPDDKAFTILTTIGSFSRSFTLATNAVALVVDIQKQGSGLDSQGRQKLRFSVNIEKQDLTRASGEDGFREYFVTADTNPIGLKVVTFEGLVTATGATGAESNFDTNIGGIETTFLTAFGGVYEAPLEQKRFLRRNLDTLLSFRREHVQLAEEVNVINSSDVESRDSEIHFMQWNIGRETENEKGNDDPNVRHYAVEWGAQLNIAKSFSVALAEQAILGLIIKRLKAQFGEDGVIPVGANSVKFSSTNRTAGGVYRFRANQGDVTIRYVETIIQDIQFARSEKVLNGRDFENQLWTPGMSGKITQIVEHKMQGVPAPIPPAPVIAGGFPDGTILVAESRQVVAGSTNIGRGEIGDGSNAAEQTIDYDRTFTTVWIIHTPPQNIELPTVTGVKGDRARSIGLY